jgi:lipoprotein-anchoring transpeptidase ErfK/SrfK
MFALSLRRLAIGGLAIGFAVSAQAQTPSPADDPTVVVTPEAQTVPPVETPPMVAPTPKNEPVVPQPEPKVEPKPEPKPVKKGPPDSLKPGQFVWEKREAYANPLRMVIVLDIQRMYVFDGDELVGFTTVSTGKKGKETPTGVFNILQKKVYHESNIYANAPMPFMQRLTWDGIALHEGYNPGYPASHGCIRLPKIFAKALYDATVMDGQVVILESLSKPLPKPQPAPEAPVEPAPTPTEQPTQPSPLTKK